jgi:galactokinase/mevalonate kinase-like predicted kinase
MHTGLFDTIDMPLGWDADPGYTLGSSSRFVVAWLKAAFVETRSG